MYSVHQAQMWAGVVTKMGVSGRDQDPGAIPFGMALDCAVKNKDPMRPPAPTTSAWTS